MIYLDYNATTPLCDAAREAMLPYLDRHFGNPSSVHAAGRETRAAIDNARDKLSALLRVKPNEIIFTSGANVFLTKSVPPNSLVYYEEKEVAIVQKRTKQPATTRDEFHK